MTDDARPVIIVGAPRSGTSLMQKVIRETPGFVSVPRESNMIWLPHCHPATNDWQYEGCPGSRITDELVAEIRDDFLDQALSANTWQMFDQFGLMQRPRLAACLRFAYRTLSGPWKRIRAHARAGHAPGRGRLVDKSVHAALWLNLVDAVFPDALYIHMVRSPRTCVPSMIQGWENFKRFRTYRVPDSAGPPRHDTSGYWCFPMPRGWNKYYQRDLAAICSFQWKAIHDAILQYLAAPTFNNRVLRIHLEQLADQPLSVLRDVSELLNHDITLMMPDDYVLPKVNTFNAKRPLDDVTLQQLADYTDPTYRTLRGSPSRATTLKDCV